MNAPEADIVETIRPAGLANQKGPRIQAALQVVYDDQGKISLDFLNDLPLDEARQWLVDYQRGWPENGRHHPALWL